jgi:tetratricopeptide (TPR) repeat protein
VDVIKRGSESQKREAILKMTQFFHPDFGSVIKMALREDSSNVVRVQAATAITKIKNNFFSQLMALEKLRRKYPDKNEILLAIASVYDDLAFSTILEPEQESEARQLALKFYEEFRAHRPNDKRLHYLIGRLMMRQGRYEEAVRWFEGAMTSELIKLDIWVLYAECLYSLKRFDELRRQARSNCDLVLQSRKYPDSICESVLFWSGRQSAGKVAA